MPNSPNTTFPEVDLTQGLTRPNSGISWVIGETLRGPINSPSKVIRSWTQFKRLYGGLIDGNDFPLDCKQALDGGSYLRVNKVSHYTDITDASAKDADKAGMIPYCFLKISAAFVASNSITFNINGVAIGTVAYATSSDNTLALLAASILAHSDVDYAEVIHAGPLTTDDRQIIFYKNSATALTIASISVTGGASQPTMTITNETMIVDGNGANLFSLAPKYEGEDYNNFQLIISDASNGDANYFKLTIAHTEETDISDTYDNLKINGQPTASNSTYLNDAKRYNEFFDFTYQDLSSLTGQLRPRNGTYGFIGGDDGGSIVDIDYIGDADALTGFHAFDNYDDARVLSTMSYFDAEVASGGADYADNREDLVFIQHLPNASVSADDLVTDIEDTGIDSSYATFIAGGNKILHPTTSIETDIAEVGAYLANIAVAEKKFGYWRAIEGEETGIIKGSLGVVNNFGGPGRYEDANLLSNRGVNLAVLRGGKKMFWHNCTALKASSDLQNLNVRFFLIGLKKTLKPFLEKYVGKQNDPTTWKQIYLKVKPELEYLEKVRAIHKGGWRYEGDQFADTEDDYTTNLPADVQQGKYKAKLFLKIVAALQEIEFSLIITPLGVEFEVANELL